MSTIELPIVNQKAKGALCDQCPLRSEPFVPSSGPEYAPVVCVGEAPGLQESIYGRPFVGKSGKLLKAVLNHAGVQTEKVFYTNTVLCRPPDNSDPPKEAIQACSQRLRDEITGRQPSTIIALGNFASKTLLGTSTGIMQLRVGPPKESPSFPNAQIIPTIHPAAALRASDYFPFIVTDVGKIAYAKREWEPPEYVVATPEDAYKRITELSRRDPLTVDIEVDVEKDLSYEHPSKYRLLCVGVAGEVDPPIVFPRDVLEIDNLRMALGECLSGARIIAHNGKFDIPGLAQLVRGTPNEGKLRLWFDTMLAHYCLDERGGIHGLKFLAREYLGAPDYSADIKKWIRYGAGFGDIPPDILHRYNAYDVALTRQLFRIFERRLADTGLRELHDFLVEASNALMQVETEGVMVNGGYLEALDRDFSARLAAQDASLQQWVANPRSPKQIMAALKSLGIETASTDVSHLRAIRKEIDKYLELDIDPEVLASAHSTANFIDALLEYRKDQKLHGTYVEGVRKRLHEGRVFSSYLLHGTTTGRLSCRNPNVQNIPRGSAIRKLFIASPGNVFVQADFKQGELRVIAALSGDEYLISVFAEGRDLLSEIAARFYGPHFTKEQRVKAKNITYGSMYAGGAHKLSEYTNGSPKEVNEFQRELWNLMPKVRQWQLNTQAHVLAGNDLATAFGRRRRYMLITDENRKDIEKECLAYVPQSTLSDICLSSLLHIVESPNTCDWIKPRITVHDSILVECNESMVEATKGVLSSVLPMVAQQRFTDRIPFPVDLQTGRSWGELD